MIDDPLIKSALTMQDCDTSMTVVHVEDRVLVYMHKTDKDEQLEVLEMDEEGVRVLIAQLRKTLSEDH